MRGVGIALGLWLLAAQAGRGGEPFRRIVYETRVLLEAEAPGVALGEGVLAYSTATTLTLVDLGSGRKLRSGPAVARGGDRPADSVHLLGIVEGKVYACARWSDVPPDDPTKRQATMRFGRQEGTLDIVALDTRTGSLTSVLALPLGALVADRLLGTSLVYVHGGSLVVTPPSGGRGRAFELGGRTRLRPKVFGERVVGLSERSVYLYRSGDERLARIPYMGTGLAPVPASRDVTFGLSGDLIVVGTSTQVFACDTDGGLRWKVAAPGHVFTGPGGEIFVNYGATRRLAPEDGRMIWCACQPCVVFFEEPAAVVSGERLALFSGSMLTVLDSATGKVVMNVPLKIDSRRKMQTSDATYFRASAQGGLIAIGFDEWVKVIDTTPTGEVPEAQRRSDPANALGRIGSLGALRAHEARWLARDLADTPEAAARMLPALQASVGGKGKRTDAELFAASNWIDDTVIVEGLLHAIGTLDGQRRHYFPVVMALASLPDRSRSRSALEKITRDSETYGTEMRKWAAMQLTWFGKAVGPARADLRLLFGGDHDAIAAEMRRRLREGDETTRASVLELLRMAPDRALVALADEFARLPAEEKRERGARLVREAKERLAAIARGHVR